jgi:DMSO/TMAO reductase YedYZ molybdopterin-dependent catalytic subunit
MSRMDRRAFLAALSRAGIGAAALAALPPWTRAGLAAAVAKGPVTPAAADFIIRSDRPDQRESTLEALGQWITPNTRFFVRNHLSTPSLEAGDWSLEITGLVRTPLTLSLADLKALPQVTAVHTLECAGNGRGLFNLPSTSGTQWERGAVGTAEWEGVRLSTVLQRAGTAPEAQHVWLEAADQAPMPGAPRFLRSIPMLKAKDDVLLAHSMNGEPLPEPHGFPLRAIVPGWYGMASTKWLTALRVEEQPSDNHFMVRGYRYVYPGEDPAMAAPVEAMKVKALITRPIDGARLVLLPRPKGKRPLLRIQGFAWAGPGGVRLVEISSDGGKTWQPAGFMGDTAPDAWRAWATEIEVTPPARVSVMARASDNAGEAQPLEARANAGGYGNNSIHKVTVNVRT